MLLSVCVPTFNRAAFIRISARFWLEQLAPFADRVELIIADNASHDETASVLRSYASLGAFRLIVRPQHLTFNETARDLVVEQARGEYVWVCGDDDYLNPGGLATAVAAIEAHRDQDHFYVPTQFVPADHPPDLAHDDPRFSPHLHIPKHELRGGIVSQTKEILAWDDGAFSGFYSSIWRRPLAVEALSGEFARQAAFTSLEATLPYAVYVARRRLELPCYCLDRPLLTVVHSVSWPHYAALFRLQIMPDLYELYRKHGADRSVLRGYELDLLRWWPRTLLDFFRHRHVQPRQRFSLLLFLWRNARSRLFWIELGAALARRVCL